MLCPGIHWYFPLSFQKGHFIGHSVGVEEIAHECIFPTIEELHWVPFDISNVWLDYLRLFDFLPLPNL